MTNNKYLKRKNHVRIFLKIFFGFAKQQEKRTFGLGYKVTLTRNTDNAVLNIGNANLNAKIEIIAIEWHVLHYTPSNKLQNLLLNQILKKMATELQYTERSVFLKEVNTQNFWIFELGTQKDINIPI